MNVKSVAEIHREHGHVTAGSGGGDESVSIDQLITIRGGIRNYRDVSSKLIFYDLVQDGEKMQVVVNYARVGGEKEEFKRISMLTRIGDVVSVTGYPGRTKSGELSIFATAHLQLLAPSLHVPPQAVLDPEARIQNRHVDLMIRPEAGQILRLRSHIIQHIRDFFVSRDFVEVQTPILSDIFGGAVAKPFLTEATNAYRGKRLALRIAPELWLKRLVIGGLDRVFEIGAQFRNEGIDNTHNPEFTTCEFYQAYMELEDIISTTEQLLSGMARKVSELKASKLKDLPEIETNFTAPFRRLEFIPALEAAMGHKLPILHENTEAVTLELLSLFKTLSLPAPAMITIPRLLGKLSSAYLEPQCTAPTFITNHPEALSPLSKTSLVHNQRVSSRVELFVNGKELVNAYEEENSPTEQRRKFVRQAGWRDEDVIGSGEDGKGIVDEAYCQALEWGLPPTGGWGVGIDRLVMVFAGTERIAEVLAFGGLRGAVNLGDGVRDVKKKEEEEGEGE
ncbi:class II aaRS and biotin synthetase [Tuber magnatum]|uniref:Lysine--tRNA ligase n=1 Tax=Tuber magnatum TaxID=42249 RepID=A0A317SSR6_9PEZI|nr:class II aaRS and biotin synthetase [Tuber magnatum]